MRWDCRCWVRLAIALEMQIDELPAELRNAVDAGERRQIAAELEFAQAEFAAIKFEQDGRIGGESPL